MPPPRCSASGLRHPLHVISRSGRPSFLNMPVGYLFVALAAISLMQPTSDCLPSRPESRRGVATSPGLMAEARTSPGVHPQATGIAGIGQPRGIGLQSGKLLSLHHPAGSMSTKVQEINGLANPLCRGPWGASLRQGVAPAPDARSLPEAFRRPNRCPHRLLAPPGRVSESPSRVRFRASARGSLVLQYVTGIPALRISPEVRRQRSLRSRQDRSVGFVGRSSPRRNPRRRPSRRARLPGQQR